MDPQQNPITGNEPDAAKAASTPYAALVQFYHAFNSRDIALMEANWSQSHEIAMDNPLGGIARGWAEIAPLYKRLFSGSMNVHVEFFDYTLHEETDIAYAVGRERGTFEANGIEVPVAIRTTRIFKKREGHWRQVHHHGSIEDSDLLRRYKAAASGAGGT